MKRLKQAALIAVGMMLNEIRQKETGLVVQGHSHSHSTASTAGTYNIFFFFVSKPSLYNGIQNVELMNVSSHECKKA